MIDLSRRRLLGLSGNVATLGLLGGCDLSPLLRSPVYDTTLADAASAAAVPADAAAARRVAPGIAGALRRPRAAHLPLLLGDDQSRERPGAATAGRARPSPASPRSASRSPPIRSASSAASSRARRRATRTLATLRFLRDAPQGDAPAGMTGHKGFFYHFVDMETGSAPTAPSCRPSTPPCCSAACCFAQGYFDREPEEVEIRDARRPASTRASTGAGRRRGGDRSSHGLESGDAASSRTTGSATTRRCWSTCSRSARPTHPVGAEAWDAWSQQLRGRLGPLNAASEHLRFAAAVRPPVHPHVGRFPRHPGRVHARTRHRLFREQPPRHLGAARLRHRQSEGLAGYGAERLGPHRLRRPGRRHARRSTGRAR